ncbi:MAG TPA: diguanylate cyclase, partial [Blastocatellia bacterium]|nr:diguanylate cyclase [Blastocatellia bacterium]
KQRLPVSSGITGWVIQNRRPMYNTNAVLDLGFLDQDAAAEYKGIMVYPLVKNQEALGAIALYSVDLDSYPSESVQIMESISQPLSDSIYNAMAFEQAQRAALTDPVTGLANMRAFTAHFEREVVRSRRSGTALSLLVADVNNLAAAASQFSLTEEELISALGARLKRRLRETDLIARHGSASYVMLLSDIGSNEAIEVLARVHEAIARAGGTPGVPPHSGLDLPGRGSPALGVGGSDPNRRPGVHPHSLLESVQPGPHGRSAADRADTGHLPRTGDRAGEAHSPRLAEFDNPAAERRRVSGPGTGQRTGPLSEQLGALSVTLGAATTPDDGEALVDLIQVARSRSLPVREGVTDFDFVSADDIPPQS